MSPATALAVGLKVDVAALPPKLQKDRFPDHFDTGWALATIYRDNGDVGAARALSELLVDRFPEHQQARLLLSSLPK